jgi:alpha/beta superfamily hydrolase
MEEKIRFQNSRGDTLVGVAHWPDGKGPFPGALVCPPFQANKDHLTSVTIARSLAEKGILAIRFDFSFIGESSGKFEDITIRGEVEDLGVAYDEILRRGANPIGLVGVSMGAIVAIVFAAESRKPAALVTIGFSPHPIRVLRSILSEEKLQQWRREGVLVLPPVNRPVKVAMLEEQEKLDILAHVRRVICPTLVLHGEADELNPVSEAEEVFQAVEGKKKFQLIRGANHVFSTDENKAELASVCSSWLAEQFKS